MVPTVSLSSSSSLSNSPITSPISNISNLNSLDDNSSNNKTLFQKLSHILLMPALIFDKYFKFLQKQRGFNNSNNSNKFSIFSINITLLIAIVVPSIFILEYSILNDEISNIPTIRNESNLKTLKKLNTNKLSELILPPYELIKNETLYSNSNYDYLFDPRLAAALWLEKINDHLEENNGILDPNFKLSFAWNDWVDLKTKLTLPTKFIKEYARNHTNDENSLIKNLSKDKYMERFENLSCSDLRTLFPSGTHEEPFYNCRDLTDEEKIHLNPNYPHSFKYLGYSSMNMNMYGRIITSASYLYTEASPPSRVVFLGAGINGSAVTILPDFDFLNTPYYKNNGYNLQYLKDYLHKESYSTGLNEKEVYEKGLKIINSLEKLELNYNPDMDLQPYYFDSELKFDQSYILKIDPNVDTLKTINLKKEDFLWDTSKVMNELHDEVNQIKSDFLNNSIENYFTIDDSVSYRLLNGMQYTLDHTDGNNFPKYLKEAVIGNKKGDHFDYRFFAGINHPDWDRQSIIHRMGRAYLRFCYSFGIRSWIAYGTMLGWYRNGLSLSWDEDIDVVMTMDSMYKIAKYHNQSLIVDVTKQDKYGSGLGSYFIDLGSSFFSREKGNGANAIDGRFIDTTSGAYIDLTAIAYTEFWSVYKVDGDMKKMIEPEYDQRKDDGRNQTEYDLYLEKELEKKYNDKLIYHCRNHNFYLFEEVSPLVPTFFEGVRAFVPHSYKKLLDRKYQGALQRNNEPGYIYKPYLRLWVEENDCPGDDNNGELCQSEDVLEEYKKTKEYTERHEKLMKLGQDKISDLKLKLKEETVPMRYDKFIIEYAHSLNAEVE